MDKILLLAPALDGAGGYRDTGTELVVDESGDPRTVSAERAIELLDAGQAAPVGA